ncbi:phytanoyl-CoA dioxygenase family protein [Novosphingobium percolationis]|uniref:phytanoyl-CoA dioxygenase family protein n=1 Tax=Novosphingobium percolationis TaxID=2871811 RepID=UPI00384EBB0D
MTALETRIGFHAAELREQGYTIIPDAMSPMAVSAIHADLWEDFERTPFGTGVFYGETTKRFGRLPVRSEQSQALILHPLVTGIVKSILSPWCDRIQLNTTQAISLHPGAPEQLPHRDQDMWRVEPGEKEYLVNVMWPLTPFHGGNGGTRLWPGSHGIHACEPVPTGPAIAPDLAPGSALLFLGSTLHAAGANQSNTERRGIVIGYALGWLKPYENPWLAYPPEVARGFPRELAELAGYVQHRPNLGNFEGQCPSILLEGYAGEPLGAIDALRPDQQAAAQAFLDAERRAP